MCFIDIFNSSYFALLCKSLLTITIAVLITEMNCVFTDHDYFSCYKHDVSLCFLESRIIAVSANVFCGLYPTINKVYLILSYTPVWKKDVLCRGNVNPSVCPSVRPRFSGLFFNMLWDINSDLSNMAEIPSFSPPAWESTVEYRTSPLRQACMRPKLKAAPVYI